MTSTCFRTGFTGFNSSLKFEIFLSNFGKMADFQGIKDSSDIFLSGNSFPLIRLSKPSTMLSLLFFPNLLSLVPYN